LNVSGAAARSEASFDDLGADLNLRKLQQNYQSDVVVVHSDDESYSCQFVSVKRKQSMKGMEEEEEEDEEIIRARRLKKGKGRLIAAGMTFTYFFIYSLLYTHLGIEDDEDEDDVQEDTGKSGVLSPSSESQGSAASKTPSNYTTSSHQTDLTRFFSNQSGRRLGGLRISSAVTAQFSHVQFDYKTKDLEFAKNFFIWKFENPSSKSTKGHYYCQLVGCKRQKISCPSPGSGTTGLYRHLKSNHLTVAVIEKYEKLQEEKRVEAFAVTGAKKRSDVGRYFDLKDYRIREVKLLFV